MEICLLMMSTTKTDDEDNDKDDEYIKHKIVVTVIAI